MTLAKVRQAQDPRGPYRTVGAVELTPSGNLTTFIECGHTSNLNPAMMAPKIGEQIRCFACATK